MEVWIAKGGEGLDRERREKSERRERFKEVLEAKPQNEFLGCYSQTR